MQPALHIDVSKKRKSFDTGRISGAPYSILPRRASLIKAGSTFPITLPTPFGPTQHTARFLYTLPASSIPNLPINQTSSPGTSRGFIIAQSTGEGSGRRSSLLLVMPRKQSYPTPTSNISSGSTESGKSFQLVDSEPSPSLIRAWRPFDTPLQEDTEDS